MSFAVKTSEKGLFDNFSASDGFFLSGYRKTPYVHLDADYDPNNNLTGIYHTCVIELKTPWYKPLGDSYVTLLGNWLWNPFGNSLDASAALETAKSIKNLCCFRKDFIKSHYSITQIKQMITTLTHLCSRFENFVDKNKWADLRNYFKTAEGSLQIALNEKTSSYQRPSSRNYLEMHPRDFLRELFLLKDQPFRNDSFKFYLGSNRDGSIQPCRLKDNWLSANKPLSPREQYETMLNFGAFFSQNKNLAVNLDVNAFKTIIGKVKDQMIAQNNTHRSCRGGYKDDRVVDHFNNKIEEEFQNVKKTLGNLGSGNWYATFADKASMVGQGINSFVSMPWNDTSWSNPKNLLWRWVDQPLNIVRVWAVGTAVRYLGGSLLSGTLDGLFKVVLDKDVYKNLASIANYRLPVMGASVLTPEGLAILSALPVVFNRKSFQFINKNVFQNWSLRGSLLNAGGMAAVSAGVYKLSSFLSSSKPCPGGVATCPVEPMVALFAADPKLFGGMLSFLTDSMSFANLTFCLGSARSVLQKGGAFFNWVPGASWISKHQTAIEYVIGAQLLARAVERVFRALVF